MGGEVETVPIWQEPVRGGYPDPKIWELGPEGIDLAFQRGRFPRAPMVHLVGTWFTAADEVHTVWEQPINHWFLSSQGVVPGGYLGVVADMATGSITSRIVHTMFSTSEMSFNFVKTVTGDSGPLSAEGRFIGASGRLALSESTITDASGAVVAHVTARNVLAEPFSARPAGPKKDPGKIEAQVEALPVPEVPDHTTPDPYLRPVVGEVLARESWEGSAGIDVLQGQIAGRVAMPPIHHLTGIRPTSAEEGAVDFAMPASAWLTSGFGTVLGGFVGFLGYSALASAIQTTTAPGMAHAPVDLKVNFLRPVFADPELRDLTAKGRVIHRGRTLSVADADVFGVDGKLVAVARGTSMLLPDSPAWAG